MTPSFPTRRSSGLDGGLEEERHGPGGQNGRADGGPGRPAAVGQVDEGDVRRGRADRALREVHEAGAAVDEDGPLREEGVRRPYAETDDQELEELLHGVVRPDRGRGPGPAPALTSLGQPGSGAPHGAPHSTPPKPTPAVSSSEESRGGKEGGRTSK